MVQNKLISLRVDEEALKKCELFCIHRPYWRKASVLAQIIYVVFTCMDDEAIDALISKLPSQLVNYRMTYERKPYDETI